MIYRFRSASIYLLYLRDFLEDDFTSKRKDFSCKTQHLIFLASCSAL